MIVSPICSMIGIEYPIFQGGMAWIADGKSRIVAMSFCEPRSCS